MKLYRATITFPEQINDGDTQHWTCFESLEEAKEFVKKLKQWKVRYSYEGEFTVLSGKSLRK